MNKAETTKKIEEAHEYMQNDTSKAIEIFDEILNADPKNIEALNGKGSSLMKLNRMNDAEKYFDYSLSIKKTSSALISKGLINKNKGNYEMALSYYEKAIHLNPNLNNIITILKNEIFELIDGEIEIDLNTSNPTSNDLIKKGLEYKKSNKLWDTLDCYQNAMDEDENCRNSVIGLVNEIKSILQNELMIKTPTLSDSRIDQMKLKSLRLLLIEENPEQALTMMNLILENNENEIDTINQKGCVMFLFDEYKESMKCFDKCLMLDKNYHYSLFNKAILLRRIGNLHEALDCFDKLLKIPKIHDKVKPYQLEILDKLHEKNRS